MLLDLLLLGFFSPKQLIKDKKKLHSSTKTFDGKLEAFCERESQISVNRNLFLLLDLFS